MRLGRYSRPVLSEIPASGSRNVRRRVAKAFMEILIVIIFMLEGISCKQKNIMKTNHDGIYEYSYPYKDGSLNENQIIKLTQTSFGYDGYYFGVSDEFDLDREGYLPGYFVSKVSINYFADDSLNFDVIVHQKKVVDKPIDIKYSSVEEAISAGGCGIWNGPNFSEVKINYGLKIVNDTLLLPTKRRMRKYIKRNSINSSN